MPGGLLIEIFRETKKQIGRPLLERDGHSSIQRVDKDDTYRIDFIEF